jgi:hypothetical protein
VKVLTLTPEETVVESVLESEFVKVCSEVNKQVAGERLCHSCKCIVVVSVLANKWNVRRFTDAGACGGDSCHACRHPVQCTGKGRSESLQRCERRLAFTLVGFTCCPTPLNCNLHAVSHDLSQSCIAAGP